MQITEFSAELAGIIKSSFPGLTEIQKKAMPKVMAGKNTFVIAPTGSGKTESAFLPVLESVLRRHREGEKGILALYIAPLRSLNRDMLGRMESWCEELGLRVEVRHGDTSQYQRGKQRKNPPQIMITTPETLQAVLPAKIMRTHLASVSYVIIDEVHELISDKRGIQLALGLERLRALSGKFQTVCLSATVGSPQIVADYYKLDEIVIDSSTRDMDIIVKKPTLPIHEAVKKETGKGQTLVFTNTRVSSESLTQKLGGKEDLGVHHSSLSKEERLATEEKLRSGKIRTLVCTSSMELGIDVGDIDKVVQVTSPRQASRLLQRVGRSGHSREKTSKGVVLTTEFDDILEAAVVAKRALSGEIEETEFYKESLDVLAHQIAGLCMDFGDLTPEQAYLIIKKAYPYRDLSADTFDSVLDTLKRLRLVGWDEKNISRRRNTLFYYYGNLSTIPTHNRFIVIDIASHKPIGALDEEYVIECNVGSIFILSGRAWRIADFRDKVVMVTPVSDMGSETPAWVGEELPVPYEVAQEVGEMRRKAANIIDSTGNVNTCAKELSKDAKKYVLPLEYGGAKEVAKTIALQLTRGVVPDDKTITIERFADNYNNVVMNTCFGTRVNDTIGRVLAAMLSRKLGEGVGINADAYRITFSALELEEKDVEDALFILANRSITSKLKDAVIKTSLFSFSFAHVGKRFGVFKDNINFREINIRRVIDAYAGTPVYEEALSECFSKRFDLPNSRKALKGILKGDIEVAIQDLTPLSQFGLEAFRDAVAAETPERAIVETVKKRLDSRKLNFVCLHCAQVMRNRSIDKLEFPLKCPACESWMIASMGRTEDELSDIVKKSIKNLPLKKSETNFLSRANQSAGLIHTYGKRALLALNARGVGPRAAARVLELDLDDDAFYKEVLREEREFVRTSRFWKK